MDPLFTPGPLGPLTLHNRMIRSAAFEGMCPGGYPSDALLDYHTEVAKGGVAMTTVAYVAVSNQGRSFAHQAWMDPALLDRFSELTARVHDAGALAAVQIGHCGNMADRNVTGEPVIAPSAVFNLFGLTRPKEMTDQQIEQVIDQFADAADRAQRAGFDAVEIHAGHGYLISQFLNPHTNRRRDQWGGSLENRMRFATETVKRVRAVLHSKCALIVKMNLTDGYRGGMMTEDAVQVARALESAGADALVLSGGFVSRTPMFVMHGDVPLKEIAKSEKRFLARVGLLLFGKAVVRAYPFEEAYFLEMAKQIRGTVSIPLILVGGMNSRATIERVLTEGLSFVAMARPLIADPDFVNRLKDGSCTHTRCVPCNKCVALMYHGEARCVL